jgi:hypothetical protein
VLLLTYEGFSFSRRYHGSGEMALFDNDARILALLSPLLILLLNAENALVQRVRAESDNNAILFGEGFTPIGEDCIFEANWIATSVVYIF